MQEETITVPCGDFTRKELQTIRRRAEACAFVVSERWKIAYADLAGAADCLDAMMARLEEQGCREISKGEKDGAATK